MNALTMARTAYASSSTPFRTARGSEYDAFANITHRLKTIDRKRNYSGFVAALHDNRSLWNILAADVADRKNELPQSLRAQIFYLAEFTEHQTSNILTKDTGLDALIDINTSIMQGLQQSGIAT